MFYRNFLQLNNNNTNNNINDSDNDNTIYLRLSSKMLKRILIKWNITRLRIPAWGGKPKTAILQAWPGMELGTTEN